MGLTGSQKAPLFARSGLARSGATRSGYFFDNLILTIGGFDRSANIEKGTLSIEDIINEQPTSASFQTFGIDVYPGRAVVIASGSIASANKWFSGRVMTATQTSTKKAGKKRYVVKCIDRTWDFNKRRVMKYYPDQAGYLVVLDLISCFTSGFTTCHVSTNSPMLGSPIGFRGCRMADAMTQVCQRMSPPTSGGQWKWYIDADSDVHFFDVETSDAPADLTATNYQYENLEFTRDISQVRTSVLVEGGGGKTTAAVAAGSTSIPVDECSWYDNAGGMIVAWNSLITYSGRSATSGPGNLTGVPSSGYGSILYDIPQDAEVTIFMNVLDSAAYDALSLLISDEGTVEVYKQDRTLNSVAAMIASAKTEIGVFGYEDRKGTYDTRDRRSRSGKTLEIHLPDRTIEHHPIAIQKVAQRYDSVGRWTFHVEFSVSSIRRDFLDLLRHLGPPVS